MRWMTARATEEWIFEAAVSLEDQGLLGEYCDQIGIKTMALHPVLVESAWPHIRAHYSCGRDKLDVTRACRDMLGFSFIECQSR